jgi:TIR domain/Tetratricopeptide repeat
MLSSRAPDYQIALSFAGEQRPLVAAVADRLAATLGREQVFYDEYHEAELARLNLDTYLQAIYHDRSRLIVLFFGADYEQKEWCGLEWRAIRDLIKRKSGNIMPVRVDSGEVSGLFGIDGYLDARKRSPEEIAARILERLNRLEPPSPIAAPAPVSRLPLTLYRNQRASSKEVQALGEAAALLSPYAFSIPLIGREPVLAELRTWLTGEAPVSIRVMTAKGGAGKTRLALELCEAVAPDGWAAGFLKEIPEPLGDWGWSGPTLVVVDYVASRAGPLRTWLAEVADRPRDRAQPLRILLLERHAEPGSGWWRDAFGSGGGEARAIQELLDPPVGPFELPPLAGLEERRRVIAAILERAGSAVRPPLEGVGDFDRKLAEISWGGEPLFLLMAGLVAARAGFGAVLALSATDLGLEIAGHEVARIERIAASEKIPVRFFSHLAAYVTLSGGLSLEQLEAVVEEEKEAMRFGSAGDPPEIAQALAVALPGKPGEIDPVLPDVVGEALVLLALGAGVQAKANAAVSRAVRTNGDRVTETLIRLTQDYGATRPEPLAWFERLVEGKAVDLDSLDFLLDQLPDSTLVLREKAATLARRAVFMAREGEPANLAKLLNNLSNRLADLGRGEEGLLAIQEAVEILRELATVRSGSFLPDLAMSLNNLSSSLADLGRREEGLLAIQEAVELRRELAALHPDFRLGLAISLNNLSNRLADLDREEEGLLAIQESAEILRELAALRPDAFRPGLAKSLNSMSLRLGGLARWEESLLAIRESIEIYRELAASQPDAFGSDLAGSLGNLANVLRELGRAEDAFRIIAEAIRTLAPYFRSFPAAFQNWMGKMVSDYLKTAEAAACEADLEFLQPIQDALAVLEEPR